MIREEAKQYVVLLYMVLSWVIILLMADKIGELQTELKKPKEVVYKTVYIDQWGNAHDFVSEK